MTKHVAFHRTTQLNSTVTNHIAHSILQAHVLDIPIKYMPLTSQQQNTEWCLHLSPALPLFSDVCKLTRLQNQNQNVLVIVYCPEKMSSELLNDPKYDKTQKKPAICLLHAATQSLLRVHAEEINYALRPLLLFCSILRQGSW